MFNNTNFEKKFFSCVIPHALCLKVNIHVQLKKIFHMYKSTEYSVFTVFYLYSQSSKDSTKTQAERMEPSDTSVKCSTEGK